MKEDILEQLTDDYLQVKGYFTQHNVKFRPDSSHVDFEKKKDSNHSDIDVLGFNPKLSGPERVLAVSCKSWQGGFRPAARIKLIEESKKISGRKAWKAFRELVKPKWSEAFRAKVYELTGSEEFTYVTAVTKVKGGKECWETYQPFLDRIEAPKDCGPLGHRKNLAAYQGVGVANVRLSILEKLVVTNTTTS